MMRAADSEVLNLDRLSAPLAGDNPCGEWLRYEGTYDRIREARREDDPGLPQGVWQTDLKRADWGAVEFLCATALAERSKDLQLAAWLLEAWMQLDSFAGAARGLELLGRLCATFWDGMYPALTEEYEARLAPIRWINDRLSRRLRLLPLTQPEMSSMASCSLADWEQALRNPNGAASSSAATTSKFEQSAALTPLDWLEQSARDAEDTVAGVKALDQLIDARAGKQSPGLIRFRSDAESAAQLLATFTGNARARIPQPAPVAVPVEPSDSGSQSAAPVHAASAETVVEAVTAVEAAPPQNFEIRTREQAYRLLHEIADFLAANDPHSPTPYLIRRAANWAEMPFDAIMTELVRDRNGLSDLGQLLDLGERAEPRR